MTIPLGGVKTPTVPGSASVGPTLFQVRVKTVDTTATPPVAVCVPPDGREIPVRIDIQRGKGSIPSVGESWVIDKSMGVWTFACYVGGDPTGSGQFSLGAVSGLSESLTGVQDDLAAHDDRMNTLFSQGTVSAVSTDGTTADVTLTDGTVAPGVQTVGSYAPAVGDTVWTGTVDAAGSKVALGTSADAGSNQQAYDMTVSHYLTTSRIRESQVNIWSDHRIAAGDQGTPAQYMISLFHTDSTGHVYLNSELDLVTYGSDMAALLKNDNYKTGMLWGNGRIYFTQNDGNSRIPIEAGGWVVGADANNNPALISNAKDLALIAGADGMHITNAANTLLDDLHAAGLWGNGLNVGTGNVTGGTLNIANHGQFGSLDSTAGIGTPANMACNTLTVGAVAIGTAGTINAAGDCNVTHHGQFGALDATSGIGTLANVACKTINGLTPASLRMWKREITRESCLDIVARAPIYWWKYTDEAAEAMADAKYPIDVDEWHLGPMVDDLPEGAIAPTEHGGTPEYFGMIKYAWGAASELAGVVKEQAKQIAALTARLDALESPA